MRRRPKINVLARKQNRKEKKKLLKLKNRKPTQSKKVSERKHVEEMLPDLGEVPTGKRKKVKLSLLNEEDPEDEEIKRLEKLLGITKDRAKKATILNKEYEEEGFGNDFVDFLDDLDGIASRANRNIPSSYFVDSADIDSDTSDSEMENDKILYSDDEDDDINEFNDEQDGNLGEEEDEVELLIEDQSNTMLDEEADKHNIVFNAFTYKPIAGQDIYGRDKNKSVMAAAGSYVPPAARIRQVNISSDDASIRRSINGLMNRLSDATKDSICKSLKDVFRAHSKNICTSIFCDTLYISCVHESQIMSKFIPLHAAVVATLHALIGFDVSCVVVENLIVKFFEEIEKNDLFTAKQSSKVPLNILILILYLYNFRVIDSALIIEIIWRIIDYKNRSVLSPYHVEMMVQVVEHAGSTLRSDCPLELKQLIAHIVETQKESQTCDVRTSVMLDMLADLKNNKSKRHVCGNQDIVHSLRKWIGSLKHLDASKASTPCIKVPLQDLLDGEQRGRWWRAGSFWEGRNESKPLAAPVIRAVENEEDAVLRKIAKKLKMNTEIRKNVFMVLMSSRDVHDVFERLARLELKGKQDREVSRVLTECCGAEKNYNPFYEEVAIVLCTSQRQNKITLQYCYWDMFKAIVDDASTVSDRKVVNLARMLVGLVCGFHLSLSVLKPIELPSAPPALLLFLATFFIALFTNKKISDSEFNSVLDRVSTTADCVHIRELFLVFLKHHFKTLPSGLSNEDVILVKKRKARTIRTMDAMSVLDVAIGIDVEGNVE